VVRDGMRFLQTIIWTALTYNPARPLGGVGFGLFCVGLLVALGLVILRLSGVDQLGPWGVMGVLAAMIFGFVGFSLFALGATFNYLVALFNKDVVQKGLFGKPIFDPPLDRSFGWMGLAAILGGLGIDVVALVLGMNGWDIERLWLYLTAGAMLMLMGMQLVIFWVIMRILDELSQREVLIGADLDREYIC